MVAGARARLSVAVRFPVARRGADERGPGRVDLDRRLAPQTLALREPRAREVPVLARLRLVEHGPVARGDVRLRPVVADGERPLGEQQARLQLPPGILEAVEDLVRDARVRVGRVEVV